MRSTYALRFGLVATLASLAIACSGSTEPGLGVAGGAGGAGGAQGTEVPGPSIPTPAVDGGDPAAQLAACTKVDFVFVIDNSGSMEEEQRNLGANFPRFVSAIESFRNRTGQSLDYRIAVTTTGITADITMSIAGIPFPLAINQRGDDGAFLQRSACGMSRRWLERGDANVASSFACIANVGTDGPGFEMPLEASKRALVDRVADRSNGSFLRSDALLAVIYLTDEEDCSVPLRSFTAVGDDCAPPPAGASTVASYVEMLDSVKGGGTAGRSRWATAVIAGATDCESSFGSAEKANRMIEFVRLAGANAVFSSICAGDLAGALTSALAKFQVACDNFEPLR